MSDKKVTISLTSRQVGVMLGGLATFSEMGDGDISHEGRAVVDEICRQLDMDGPKFREAARKDLRKPWWKR